MTHFSHRLHFAFSSNKRITFLSFLTYGETFYYRWFLNFFSRTATNAIAMRTAFAAVVALVVSRLVFQRALARYRSASS